jgi:glutathione S-transferase
MTLYHSPTSPYVRKVRVVAIEKGLGDRIELIDASPGPPLTAVFGVNPLGKVPALVTDDGIVLYDSPVICEYLDSLVPAAPLIPRSGPAERSAQAQEHSAAAIRRSVAALATELRPADAPFDLGQISVAAALGYLEFRLGDADLGTDQAAIRDWWSATRHRPSLAATRPP